MQSLSTGGSRVVYWIIDVVSRLMVEKTYVEGGFLAPTHVDRACREAGVEKNRMILIDLLTRKGVLIQRKRDTVLYLDPSRARTLVTALLENRTCEDTPSSARDIRTVCVRLSEEASRRRELARTPVLEGLLTRDLAIAFNTLRGLAKPYDGEYRVCLPADIAEIDDGWLDRAFVPVTRRLDFVEGMERLLSNRHLFRLVGKQERGVVYRFCLDPHTVNVHLPDTAPIPRPARVRISRPPVEMRAAI